MIDELKLRDETGYIGVYGDQVFTQVLEFGFKNLRRNELDKAVGGELEGVVPVDLEDMVYSFEPLPPAPAAITPAPDARGRVAPPSEGMRVLTYAMRRERAEQLIEPRPRVRLQSARPPRLWWRRGPPRRRTRPRSRRRAPMARSR